MRMQRRPRRGGFSLLEVLLASVITVLLMSGLYVAMDVQLRQAEAGRDLVQQATLVRAIVQKVSGDLAPSITVVQQVKATVTSSSSSGTTSTSGGTTSSGSSGTTSTSSAAASGGSGGSSASGGSSGSSTETSISASTTPVVPSQAGVIGDQSSVSIYVARVPSAATQGTDSAGDAPPTAPDVRMVSYTVGEGGGLIRQEKGFVNSLGVDDESGGVTTTLIAEEVTQIQFQYWDGASWAGNWDGSALGDDLLTPIGPPMAIEVRLWIRQPGGREPKMFRHVIALCTGMPPQTQANTTTTPMQ